MEPLRSFVCIGAGNVAWHLCRGLTAKGFNLKQVYSRTSVSSSFLASEYSCGHTSEIKEISRSADFYLICVSDIAINDILSGLLFNDKLILHTSGSTGIDIFKGKFKSYGVLYPLQTLSMNHPVDISRLPFLIEGSDQHTTEQIRIIAGSLSQSVLLTTGEQRKWYHISAVMVSNFTNFMYSSAYKVMENKALDFSLLFPLMEETLQKAKSGNPVLAQTGPARRGDSNITDEHIKMLSYNPVLQKLYTFISSNISDFYKRTKK